MTREVLISMGSGGDQEEFMKERLEGCGSEGMRGVKFKATRKQSGCCQEAHAKPPY